jgi:hypothetical protein
MSAIIASSAALAYGGLAAISFTMDRHYADIHGRGAEPDSRTRRRFRTLGWAGLILSFIACIAANGWHTGPVLWCGMLTASAIVLTLLLQYAPHRAIRLARVGYLGAPVLAAGWFLLR